MPWWTLKWSLTNCWNYNKAQKFYHYENWKWKLSNLHFNNILSWNVVVKKNHIFCCRFILKVSICHIQIIRCKGAIISWAHLVNNIEFLWQPGQTWPSHRIPPYFRAFIVLHFDTNTPNRILNILQSSFSIVFVFFSFNTLLLHSKNCEPKTSNVEPTLNLHQH